jgi:SAM-dependent methyltransferase
MSMNCPICQDARPPQFVFRAHGATLARCPACGVVRVHPLPEAQTLLAQYAPSYFKDAERGYVDYDADEAVFRAEFRRRLRALRAAGARGALFDVGCANGALLREAQAAGFEASGLEPSPEMARRASARSGCRVRAGSIEDALLEGGRFDVVTLFDVLEHLCDPLPVLRKLRLSLVPGGLLAVTVPDFGGWWARLTGPRWPFVTPWEHVLYFTRRSLVCTLEHAGFQDITFRRAQTPLSFGTLTSKLPALAPLVPPALRAYGVGLPMGTLFALARSDGLP